MIKEIKTPYGTVRVGSVIKIIEVFAETTMFPDGIDYQAKAMEGKTGKVLTITNDGLRGTWGGLSVLPEKDKFKIIKF